MKMVNSGKANEFPSKIIGATSSILKLVAANFIHSEHYL